MNENESLNNIKDNKIKGRQILKYVLLVITFPIGFLFYGIYQLSQGLALKQSNPDTSLKKIKKSIISIIVFVISSIAILLFANYYYYNIDTTTNVGEIRYEGYSRKEQEKMFNIISSITNNYSESMVETFNLTKNGQYKNANIVFKQINSMDFITYDKFEIIVDENWNIIKEEKTQQYEISKDMKSSIIDTCKDIIYGKLYLPQTADFSDSDSWRMDISEDGKTINVVAWVWASTYYGTSNRAYCEFVVNTSTGVVDMVDSWQD